jgi:hypothetical protein
MKVIGKTGSSQNLSLASGIHIWTQSPFHISVLHINSTELYLEQAHFKSWANFVQNWLLIALVCMRKSMMPE